MISDLSDGRTARRLLAVVLAGAALFAYGSAWGGIEGRELVVTLEVPASASAEQTRQVVEAQIVTAAACGADGVIVAVPELRGETAATLGDLSARTTKHRVKLWIAVPMPNDRALDVARACKSLPVAGLALVFTPPKGEPPEPDRLATLLSIKRRGDDLGCSIHQIKRQLGSSMQLAVCLALSEMTPETARSRYVPIGDLVRDGTVNVVALGGAERFNFHRLRLLRDMRLRAGGFLDANGIDERRRAGCLSRGVLDAVENETSELLWLRDFPIGMVGQVAPAAAEGLEKSRKRQADVEAAVAEGRLVVDQQISEKGAHDQASLHGVAQSFTPSRDGACPLVQVYATIRGSKGALPPPLHVEIRANEQGQPGPVVLAKAEIPAAEFGLDPTYRWGSAHFDTPPRLIKGQTYWIALTNKTHPDGNYVWRMVKDAAGRRGHAWSSRYDYTPHAWVFRVYLDKEPTP